MKASQIILQNYDKLLLEVKNYVEKTAESISKIATRKKVEMAWNIGRAVQKHLEENNQSEKTGYGKHLFERLETDVSISQSALYKMRNFYKSYPKLPRDDDKLNWSHYRVLAGVKDEDRRKYLEDLAREENLDAEKLRKKLRKIRKPQISENKKSEVKKLNFKRGKLFCYELSEVAELGVTCVDCGFGILHQLEKNAPKDAEIVETIKRGEKYLVKKLAVNAAKLNAYKAYLRKVVDGDTIHVILDLGFKIFHEEILRLRQIDAPEFSTSAGKKSARELKKILQNLPFLIVKTHTTDIYGRYLADVFLPDAEGKFSVTETVEKGEYLSQILLDKNLVKTFA
ncbi:MAG: hypothetical protein KGP29_03070 [Proteobacteria bacterium]|nr:hypothetical protein [Pseudomonadota bacterium]